MLLIEAVNHDAGVYCHFKREWKAMIVPSATIAPCKDSSTPSTFVSLSGFNNVSVAHTFDGASAVLHTSA